MPWFKNIVTGVSYELEGERTLEVARGNTDLEELSRKPRNVFGEVGSSKGIDGDFYEPKLVEGTVEQRTTIDETPEEPVGQYTTIDEADQLPEDEQRTTIDELPEATTPDVKPDFDEDALDALDRDQLVDLAQSMNIKTSGKNMDKIKAEIRAAE